MVAEPPTLQRALSAATAILAGAGVSEPRREALRLFSDVLDQPVPALLLDDRQVLAPEIAAHLDALVRRRAAGEPLAYVTGVVGFRHLVLRSDRRALIPRPETEGLVDRVLATGCRGTVVDIGAGTGCIALALASEGGFERVAAVDRSADALALAAENRRRTGIGIQLIRGDLTGAVRSRCVEVVVSNPPYLTQAEYLAVAASVRDYEPVEALSSGADGLSATRLLARDAGRVVVQGGWLVIEIAADRPAESAAQVAAAGWSDIRIESDLFARPRYLMARWRKHD